MSKNVKWARMPWVCNERVNEEWVIVLIVCYNEAEASIKDMISNLSSWAAPRTVSTPLMQVKGLSSSQIIPEPKGVVLVISPWNYPIQLPIIGITATTIDHYNILNMYLQVLQLPLLLVTARC